MDGDRAEKWRSRDGHEDPTTVLDLGTVVFDRSHMTLWDRAGNRISLGHQATRVLQALAEWPGQKLTKDELLAAAWDDLQVSENNLSQCILQIRRAIGDPNGLVVKTVPKSGYMLMPPPAEAVAVQSSPRPWHAAVTMGLIAGAIALGALVDLHVPPAPAEPTAKTRRNATGVGVSKVMAGPSIAVLPFRDTSGEERWSRLGEGLAIDLSGQLARHAGLHVRVRGSAFAPGVGSNGAAEGAVRLVLDGTLAAQDARLRVTARMRDTADDRVVWSQTWEGPAEDIFRWQDEILARVVASVTSVWSGALSEEVLAEARRRPPENLDAYELYILGSAEKHVFTEESLRRAVTHLESAVAIDPRFARAWAALDLARTYLADFAATREERETLVAASLEARRRAYAADPRDPQVLVRNSGLLEWKGEIVKAARMLRRAVASAPSDADILAQAAFTAAWRGITGDEPVAWSTRALELNAEPPDWYLSAHGMALFHAGRYAEAASALARGAQLNDAVMVRAAAEALSGNLDAARDTAAWLRVSAPTMIANDILPNTNILPSWNAFLDGAHRAGITIDTAALAPARAPVSAGRSRIGVPLGPRAVIGASVLIPEDLEREELARGGEATPAVGDHSLTGGSRLRRNRVPPEFLSRRT